jgi:hypothetical protein
MQKQKEEKLIAVAAPPEEWQALERLITSYRQQCKAMRHHSPMLAHLNDFQRRFTQATGWKSPDDYMI